MSPYVLELKNFLNLIQVSITMLLIFIGLLKIQLLVSIHSVLGRFYDLTKNVKKFTQRWDEKITESMKK